MIEENKLVKYYSEIAEKLDEMIPCEWEKVYLYDKDDSLTSTQRRIRWAYEELNIIPNGGYGRKLLKEYLEEQGRELPEELKKC